MRTLLAATLLASITFTLAGCPGLGCGAYSGGGDKVYARGSDQLILCENGGYAADLATSTLEGFYTENAAGSTIAYTGTDGPTDQHAFDLSNNADGTVSIPQLGADAWAVVSLDKTGLDHANARCQDLETRTWWTATH